MVLYALPDREGGAGLIAARPSGQLPEVWRPQPPDNNYGAGL